MRMIVNTNQAGVGPGSDRPRHGVLACQPFEIGLGKDRHRHNAYNSHSGNRSILGLEKFAMLSLHPRRFALLLMFALPLSAFGLDADGPERKLQTIHHLLEYVAVEYPQFVQGGKVLDQGEYAEQV